MTKIVLEPGEMGHWRDKNRLVTIKCGGKKLKMGHWHDENRFGHERKTILHWENKTLQSKKNDPSKHTNPFEEIRFSNLKQQIVWRKPEWWYLEDFEKNKMMVV